MMQAEERVADGLDPSTEVEGKSDNRSYLT